MPLLKPITFTASWSIQNRPFASNGSQRGASSRRLARASLRAARLSQAGQRREEDPHNELSNADQGLIDSSASAALARATSPATPSQIAAVVGHSALVVARPIEW